MSRDPLRMQGLRRVHRLSRILRRSRTLNQSLRQGLHRGLRLSLMLLRRRTPSRGLHHNRTLHRSLMRSRGLRLNRMLRRSRILHRSLTPSRALRRSRVRHRSRAAKSRVGANLKKTAEIQPAANPWAGIFIRSDWAQGAGWVQGVGARHSNRLFELTVLPGELSMIRRGER